MAMAWKTRGSRQDPLAETPRRSRCNVRDPAIFGGKSDVSEFFCGYAVAWLNVPTTARVHAANAKKITIAQRSFS